jgi:protein TonB
MTDAIHPEHAAPLQDDASREGATPLTWLLLALAIAALGWWYSSQRNTGAVPETIPVANTATTAEPAAPQPRQAAARRPAAAATRPRTAAAPSTRDALLLAHAQPRYPADAQRRGVEGNVLLRIAVDANGVPIDIGYAERSGNRELDRAALSAARDWRFRPATRDGRTVATTVNVPVRFALAPASRG